MILYDSKNAPNPRRVRIFLAEKGVSVPVQQVDIGTLENGKFADLVIVDGDPLANIDDLFKVKAVIKEGQIVVVKR